LKTKPGGDGRLSPPDSPALVGPHKGWAAGSGGPASPTRGLLYRRSKYCAVIDALKSQSSEQYTTVEIMSFRQSLHR